MVNCYKCKYGKAETIHSEELNTDIVCLYCYIDKDYMSDYQAKEDVDCEFYVENMDDNKTKKPAA